MLGFISTTTTELLVLPRSAQAGRMSDEAGAPLNSLLGKEQGVLLGAHEAALVPSAPPGRQEQPERLAGWTSLYSVKVQMSSNYSKDHDATIDSSLFFPLPEFYT